MNGKKQSIVVMVAKIALFPLGVYLQLQYTLGGTYGTSSRWYNFGVHDWVETYGSSPTGSIFLAILGGILLLVLAYPKNEHSMAEIIWMYFVCGSLVVLGVLMGVKMSWLAGGVGIIISVVYTWVLHGAFGKDVLFSRIKENQTEDIKQSKYDKAINEKRNAISESDYGKAADLFDELGDYKDSKQMRIVCLQLAGDEKCSEIYNNAKLKMASNKKKDLTDAINMFNDISHWEDSKEQLGKCRQIMKKKRRTSTIIIIAIICLFFAGIVVAYKVNESSKQATLEKEKPIAEQKEEAVGEKEIIKAMRERQYVDINQTSISAGYSNTVALKDNGTVVSTNQDKNLYEDEPDFGENDVDDWRDIVAIKTSGYHTVGLRKNGTVISTKIKRVDKKSNYDHGQTSVESWKNITAIAVGSNHTVGLKKDGTVVSTKLTGDVGNNGQTKVDDWKDIIAIAADDLRTVGIKKDGTVVSTDKDDEVEDWKNIIAVSCEDENLVGVKIDGTVVSSDDYSEKGEVENWSDITAVSTSANHTVGLKADGTVVSTAVDDSEDLGLDCGQTDVDGWTDIVAISATSRNTIGLRSDGTVVSTKFHKSEWYKENNTQTDVNDWKNIRVVSSEDITEDEKNTYADNPATIIKNDRFVITRGKLEEQITKLFKKINSSTKDITKKDDKYYLTYKTGKSVILVKISNSDEPITNNDVIKCLVVVGKHGEENGKYYAAVASLFGDSIDYSSLAQKMDAGMSEMMKNKETNWREQPLEDNTIYYAVATTGEAKGLELCAFFSKEMDIKSALEKYGNQW